MGVPCKDCLLELIRAGVSEVVCIRETYYDEPSRYVLKEWIENGGKFRILSKSCLTCRYDKTVECKDGSYAKAKCIDDGYVDYRVSKNI